MNTCRATNTQSRYKHIDVKENTHTKANNIFRAKEGHYNKKEQFAKEIRLLKCVYIYV